jgi:hypothetical protein
MYSVQQIFDGLRRTNADLDKQIGELKKFAEFNGCEIHEIKEATGAFMLTPLLVAKASCMNGFAVLKAAELKNKKP